MTSIMRKLRPILMFAAILGALSIDDIPHLWSGSIIPSAQARVGRPATPMSYAGAARRTTRRTYATGVAVGAAAATTRCTRVVDAYGRVITRCY